MRARALAAVHRRASIARSMFGRRHDVRAARKVQQHTVGPRAPRAQPVGVAVRQRVIVRDLESRRMPRKQPLDRADLPAQIRDRDVALQQLLDRQAAQQTRGRRLPADHRDRLQQPLFGERLRRLVVGLAVRHARDRVHLDECARPLVAGHLARARNPSARSRRPRRRAAHRDQRDDLLPEALVGEADHEAVGDAGVRRRARARLPPGRPFRRRC